MLQELREESRSWNLLRYQLILHVEKGIPEQETFEEPGDNAGVRETKLKQGLKKWLM